MHCPCCGSSDLRVLTGTPEREWRLRLRRCSSCSHKLKTIEIPADQVVAFRQPIERTKHRGSRLAVIATRVSLVRNLLRQLQFPPRSA